MNQDYAVMLIERVQLVIDKLKSILNENNIHYENEKISELLKSFNKLRTIKPNHKYIAVELNELGYIKNLIETDIIADPVLIPEDILRGYYKVVDGKIVLDVARKSVLWEG